MQKLVIVDNSKSDKNYQKMQDSTHNITHCGKISILTSKIPIYISKVNVLKLLRNNFGVEQKF